MIDINNIKQSAKSFVNNREDIKPTVFIESNDGTIYVGSLAMLDKSLWPSAMRALLTTKGAFEYALVHEAWLTRVKAKSSIARKLRKGEKSISDLPADDRQEVVILLYVKRFSQNRVVAWMAEIKEERGKRWLGPWKPYPGYQSRFILNW